MSAPGGRRPGPRWTWVAFVLLLVVPLAEIAVIIAVGKVIGGWPTLGLLLLESAIGAWLVRREGRATWLALREALSSGRMPAGELSDAALVLVGGTLLLAPGFLTDVLGFACVLPGVRVLARRVLTRVVTRRLLASAGPAVTVWSTGGPGRTPPGGGSPFGGSTPPFGGTSYGDTPYGSTSSYGPGSTRRPADDDDDIIEGEIL